MRLYAVGDEVRIRLGRALRDWRSAGLVSPAQEATLGADVATDYRRAGLMLRLGLAAFTVIAGAAAIGLVFLITGIRSEIAVSLTAAALGVAAFGAADGLVRRFTLYRHGVEEALALGAVGLSSFGVGLLASEVFPSTSDVEIWVSAMAATAIASAAVYRRFGFQYAAVGTLYAIAVLPMAFGAVDGSIKRLFAALVCAGAYVYATGARRRADDDVSRSDAEVVRAAAVVGAYVALNLFVLGAPFERHVASWYWWASWVVTWMLPFVVGRAAVRERDPLLLRVALAAGLASLLTNKAHLGWPRQPWDPMLLGVVLAGAALTLRRWLSSGEGGERNGFTSRQLVPGEDAAIQLASLAAVAVQPTPTRQLPEPTDTTFSGGRSGGAGAGGEF